MAVGDLTGTDSLQFDVIAKLCPACSYLPPTSQLPEQCQAAGTWKRDEIQQVQPEASEVGTGQL